jgi:hypothetical protein
LAVPPPYDSAHDYHCFHCHKYCHPTPSAFQSINQCYTCSYEAQKAHASHSIAFTLSPADVVPVAYLLHGPHDMAAAHDTLHVVLRLLLLLLM